MKYEVDGTQYIHDEIEADSPQEAAAKFREHYGVIPDGVGDFTVIGGCEVCGRAIFDGDKYGSDSEGVMWHEPECVQKEEEHGK